MSVLPQGWYVQQWQYGGSTAAEQSIDDTIQLALEYRAAGILEKVMDGLTWMGDIAPGSPAQMLDVIQHQKRCRDEGLIYIPWINPLWGDEAYLMQQARQYAAIGRDCGYLAWDTEPYEHFWGANRPAGDAARMLDEFRRLAPSCVNIWQPDPRPGRLAELRPDEWAPYMNVIAGQHYWDDFGTSPDAEMVRADGLSQSFGLPCAPTISASGSPEEFRAAIIGMGNRGMTACIGWRLGTLGQSHLSVLRALAGKQDAPIPDQPGDCRKIRDELTMLRDGLDRLITTPYRRPAKRDLIALRGGD